MNELDREVQICIPEYIRKIIVRLGDEGYDAYAVGGCVRDSILGRIPHDWDVTTAADPHETMRIFADGDIRVIGTAGVRHGTVMVKSCNEVCEITTFRSDGDYKDHRRPDSVTFSHKVDDDLARRDFTMNAIAVKPQGDCVLIVDPFGGIEDTRNCFIRTVGDPIRRFGEDALRILRAVRFTSELGFEVDFHTADAANRLADTLAFVSAERITEELLRTLAGDHLGKAVDTFGDVFGWLKASGRLYKLASETNDPLVRLALMAEHGSDGKVIFDTFRLPSKTVSVITKLLAINNLSSDVYSVCDFIRDFGDNIDTALEYIRVTGLFGYEDFVGDVRAVIRNGIPCDISDLAVTGRDAIDVGFAGAGIKVALELLLRDVQAGKIPNDVTALRSALKINRSNN